MMANQSINGGADSITMLRAALACGRGGCNCGRSSGHLHCPTHDPAKDGRPDLSVSSQGGRSLVYCFVCGRAGQETLLAELKSRGLWLDGDGGDGSKRVETDRKEWLIRDVAGAVQAIHERIEYSDGSKNFRWRQPDGRAGLNGRKSATLPLYGSELLSNLSPGSTVIVCEGEKAADAVRKLGVAAVGTVTGAGNPIHVDDVLRVLLPFEVVLWPDNDTKGHAHMREVGQRLLSLGLEA